jgi:peptide/nickel transport system substrate-binding protein
MKRRMSWRLGAFAALVLLVVATVGASAARSALSGSEQASASTLVDGTTDTVTNIDPAGSYDYGTATLQYQIFQGLYFNAPGNKLTPTLATGCEASANLKTWTCALRSGVKFSDGSTFDSSDVKFSFDRVVKIKDPSGIYTLFSNLKSVSTAGAHRVVFHLKSPQSTWPLILTTSAALIVPSNSSYSANKILPSTSTQIGTGPYKLVKFTPGQQAVLQANPNYSGPKPKTSNLIVNYYAKSSTMKLALTKGEIDMSFISFTPTELASLAKTKGITVWKGQGSGIRYLGMTVKRAPTNAVAVRRALAYLIPRQTIATKVYHGLVTPLYSLVPAGDPGHIDAFATLYGRKPNPAKAKAVLKAAGVTTPVAIDVWYTPSHYGDSSADEYAEIKRAFEATGLFKVTLKTAEWAQYVDTWGKSYNVFQGGWYPDYPDAENYVDPFYAPTTFITTGYNSPAMNRLITKEHSARTTAVRLATVRAEQLLAAKDVPIIPYMQLSMVAVSRNNVHGIAKTLDAAYLMRFSVISKS